jgi:predicted transcriptional regulator YheO
VFEERQLSQAFALLSAIAEAIVAVAGDRCCVVVRDLRTTQPIIRVYGAANAIDDPHLLPPLDEVSNDATTGASSLAPPAAPRSAEVWIRDLTGHPVGGMTILWAGSRTDAPTIVERLVAALPATFRGPDAATAVSPSERAVVTALAGALRVSGRSVAALPRQERIALVRTLDQAGVFSIRRAVETMARDLGVSRATMYAYLRAARQADGASSVA